MKSFLTQRRKDAKTQEKRSQTFDLHIAKGGAKIFYLLDGAGGGLLSEPKPDDLEEVETAIAFLKRVWGDAPPDVLVVDMSLLGLALKFEGFLHRQGVVLEVLHPGYVIQRGKIERAIWRQEREAGGDARPTRIP